jgi:hypothetical protein
LNAEKGSKIVMIQSGNMESDVFFTVCWRERFYLNYFGMPLKL